MLNTQLGFNPRILLRSLRGLPRYLADLTHFRRVYRGKLTLLPCLYDWYEEGGASNNEYFWQDLYVAREINLRKPQRHVDVGSRLDGFVAHVASFRNIEVFDIRPVTPLIPGVIFKQMDLMNPKSLPESYCDSISSLHALEHFGLGRYGDPIDVNGYRSGLSNMVKILKPGGIFYLSVPIGEECVEFNAHRIFDPCALRVLASRNRLELSKFSWIETGKGISISDNFDLDLLELSKKRYALGIFTFIKNGNANHEAMA
jgi:SAM-dependent methyltransferase